MGRASEAGSRAAGGGTGVRLRHAVVAAAAVLAALFPLAVRNDFFLNMLILTCLLVVLSSGWNVVSGYAGYVSLGHSAFLGVGAYTVALLALRWQLSPFLLAPLGALAAAVLAAVVGLVMMRARGHAFVIMTIAFLFIMQLVTLNASFTNGSHGLTLPLPTWSRQWQNVPFYYAMALLAALSVGLSAWVRRTKFGLGLLAIREDEEKAAAMGVPTGIYKVSAFAASTFLVGAAGGVYAYYLTFIDPLGLFNIIVSVQTVLAVMLGGRGTVWGPVLGAFVVEPLSELANTYFGASQVHLVLFGALMMLVVLFLPRGVLPTLAERLERRRRLRAAAAEAGAPVRLAEVGEGGARQDGREGAMT
ncbi:MAG: branched-chain amino acid ABC transporter permease [Bacillota bacterium]|nr:branched-chain amino acid ABC transporter permease [Bacillota bacterium]